LLREIFDMDRLAGLATVPSWFVVLADCDSARSLAPVLRDQATQQISHPSGRPWLLGCWADGTVTTGQAGQTKIALIGQHIGPIRCHGRVTNLGVEDPPDTGDGPLHSDPPGHRGDQVRAAHQRCCQPIQVGNCPDPTGGLGQLVGRDGVLADQGDLGLSCPTGGHRAVGPAPKQPRAT